MTEHMFILTPGQWLGEGRVTFSYSPEHLRCFIKWMIEKDDGGNIHCRQYVEMEGGQERVVNTFLISNVSSDSFTIRLSNDLMGAVEGKGVIDKQTLAWEFHGEHEFEGFEVYETQDNGDYMLHAEYSSTEHFRTIIDGRIWKKASP